MEQNFTPYFIAIDDDRIDNMICSKIIEQTLPSANVKTFTDPELGLEYMQSLYTGNNEKKHGVLFLDINMPTLTGWEVLDKIVDFTEIARQHIKIFILSSSVNPKDKEQADKNPLVSGFIQKPLTKGQVEDILKGV